MPFQITYRNEGGRLVTLRNITKVEGVWAGGGALSHYCFYEGTRPTEHRRLGMVRVNDVVSMSAHLPELRP